MQEESAAALTDWFQQELTAAQGQSPQAAAATGGASPEAHTSGPGSAILRVALGMMLGAAAPTCLIWGEPRVLYFNRAAGSLLSPVAQGQLLGDVASRLGRQLYACASGSWNQALVQLSQWRPSADASPLCYPLVTDLLPAPICDDAGQTIGLMCSLVVDASPGRNAGAPPATAIPQLALDHSCQERYRLSTLVHDELQQVLFAARMQLHVLDRRQKQGQPISTRELDRLLDHCLSSAQSLATDLYPPSLRESNLLHMFESLRELAARTELAIEVIHTGPELELEAESALVLWSTLRQLLEGVQAKQLRMNVISTSAADVLTIELQAIDGRFLFPPDAVARQGLSHEALCAQLALVHGWVEIATRSSDPCIRHLRLCVPTRMAVGNSRRTGQLARRRPSIRVLLADDHHIVRQQLARLLSDDPEIEVVGQANDGASAVALARELQPTVVMLDVTMPVINGIEAARRIIAECRGTLVVGLSMHEEPTIERAMRAAGAAEYLVKGASPRSLIEAIHRCAAKAVPRADA